MQATAEAMRRWLRAMFLFLSWSIFLNAALPARFPGQAAGAPPCAEAAAPERSGIDQPFPPALEPVIVTAPRIPSAIEEVPAAISVVPREFIQNGRTGASLKSALDGVAGVFAQNQYNFAQDLRISIRGFGSRSAFGIRGIRIYADGLPLTLADGQSQIDLIDPDAVQRIEVMRGPSSALFGNSSGGSLHITTPEGPEDPMIKIGNTVGEFGLWKSLVQGGGRTGRSSYFLSASHLQTHGFRDHGEAETWKMGTKIRYDLDDRSDLMMVLNTVYSPRLKDPGGLTQTQAEDDPGQAASVNLRFDTREKAADGRLGVVYRRALPAEGTIEAGAYYQTRELENAIPFRFIELSRRLAGAHVQFDKSADLFGLPHRVMIGVDGQRQSDDRRNFDNADGDAGNTLLLDQDETVGTLGFFLQERIEFTPKWSALAAGRYDYAHFEVSDRLTADGDDSGSRTFEQATGRLGLMVLPSPDVQAYLNVAQSFETPTTTEIVNRPAGGGGINPHLRPEKAVNYEIGMKSIGNHRLSWDAALFFISLKDELIAFRDDTDRVFYRNAGESRRAGFELGLAFKFAGHFTGRSAYTYLEAEFEKFEKDGRDLQGNQVPGLPRHQFATQVLYEQNPGDPARGWFAGLDLFHTAKLYADDENTTTSGAFTTVNARVGYRKTRGHWRIVPFGGVDNLLDQAYNSNVRINAAGGRFFEPAPGINVYCGLDVAYHW